MISKRILMILLVITLIILMPRTLAKLGLPPSTTPYRDYQDQTESESEEDDLLLARP